MRRLVCLLLCLILPLQALALQGGWSQQGEAFDLAHEIAHQQGTSHHHEDSGSIHYDESPESAQHLADHEACQSSASLLPAVLALPGFSPASVNIDHSGRYVPDRFPECPQRPPSASA